MDEKKFAVRPGEEAWELNTPGRVWVEVVLDASKGTTKMLTAVGKGSVLRLKTEDRQFSQERCRMKKHDIFTNGIMTRLDADVSGDPELASPSAVSDDDLKTIFAYKQVARFKNAVMDLTEVAARRMLALVDDVDATKAQSDFLEEHIKDTWPVNQNPLDADRHYRMSDIQSAQVVTNKGK